MSELPAAGPWAAWKRAHLHDYTAGAVRFWLAIVLAGVLALSASVNALMQAPAGAAWPTVAGLALVATAALFPVQLPRIAYAVVVADVFVFAMLASLGWPAATLAAALEGLIGAWRSSGRASARISSPAAAAAAMAISGLASAGVQRALVMLGIASEIASLSALCLASLASVALNTGPLMKLMAVKRGHTFSLSEWGRSSTWIAAISLGSAFVAGLVHLNAVRYGPGVYAVGAAVVLALAVLLRLTIGNLERERSRQEARLTIAQREAELSQQRFTAAFTHAAIGMAIVHADGRMLQVNHALCLLLGRADSDLLGHPFRDLLHPGDEALLRRHTEEITRRPDETYSMELRCDGADGQQLWVALYCSRYEDPGDAGPCLIYQLHDITSRRVAENRLHHIAFHDGLTDLANRHCFNERLELAVEESRLDDSVRFAVLFLDLDRFKIVNDSLGHIAGNTLLREVAQRLQTCVRPCDLVARLGGDEFAILLPALHDADAGLRLAQRVLDALSLSLSINGTEVVPGASVGITFSDLGYRTVDEVLRDADLAMYEAKAGGRGRVALFDISMHERAADKLALEADLRRAIGEGQLSVQFQPLYELEPYRLYGFEALARWVHPVRGPVSPAVFIALAEESGHIEALTDWVIDHSVAQLALWQRTLPDTAHLGMHVNISGRDLARADLAERVQQVLERHALAAPCLTLEITETTLMGKLDLALQTMGRLRESGVRFSIDDFGTGYSSLAYLGSLPIDSLKIDRSFVMSLHEKPQNVEIVRAILNLAQSLGRRVVAEGIETPEQLATLRRLGVHIGQGYLLSRPLRAAQIVELLSLATASAPA